MSVQRQEIEQLWTDGIKVLPGRRPINFDVVDQLAQSMDRIGLRHPITVRALNEINIQLVAGHHRLEAAKKLGWEKIACVVLEADECSDVEAELWEIAENLHRADLSKKQRDEQIRRYAHLIAIRDADLQSGQNDRIESKRADKRGHRLEGVASKTAKETGVSVRTVRRALADDRPKPIKAPRGSLKREQQPVAPVHRFEPSDLGANAALDAAEEAVERRRDFLASWEKLAPADREWGFQIVSHWKNSLPAHDSDTGEIIEEHAAESFASPQIEGAPVAASMSEEGMGGNVSSSQSIPISEPPAPETGSGEPERPFLVAPEPTIPTGAEFPQARDGCLTEEETVDAEAPVAAQADDLMTVKSTDPVAPIPASGITATGGIMPDLPPMFDRRGRA